MEITVIGDLTENQAWEKYKHLLSSKLITHHSKDKFSGTDLLITNSKGRTVRVQAKNLATAYQSFLVDGKIPGMISLEKDTKYLTLIQELESKGLLTLSDEDLSNISYLLANEIWFRLKGSLGEDSKRKISQQTGGLQYSQLIAEKIFSKQVANFLGVSLQDSFVLNDNKASGSNIF